MPGFIESETSPCPGLRFVVRNNSRNRIIFQKIRKKKTRQKLLGNENNYKSTKSSLFSMHLHIYQDRGTDVTKVQLVEWWTTGFDGGEYPNIGKV